MKLVQKLPIGLALAACMLMSSCSQEDVALPENGKTENRFNNHRGGGPLQGLPQIPTTDGTAGNHVFAPGWAKVTNVSPDDPVKQATGTSTKTHLWGDQNFSWTKPLLNPPGASNNDANNFVTVMNQKDLLGGFSSGSSAKSTIKQLKPGKKYAVTISVASTVCIKNGEPTQYAPSATIFIPGTIGGNYSATEFNLGEKQAEWVTKTIVFEAQSTEAEILFSNFPGNWFFQNNSKYFFYAHVFVGKNAIVEVP